MAAAAAGAFLLFSPRAAEPTATSAAVKAVALALHAPHEAAPRGIEPTVGGPEPQAVEVDPLVLSEPRAPSKDAREPMSRAGRVETAAPERGAEANVQPGGVPFDRKAAAAALDASGAPGCRQGDEPVGVARVFVTFSPTTGHATAATIDGPPYTGTETGACILRALRATTVAPFQGEDVTMLHTISLE